MEIRTLTEVEIRSLIGPADALAAVRGAFAAFADGRATLPGVIGMEFHEHDGEAHIKGAYLHGEPYWSIKAATGFYDNPALGLPMLGGLSLVFSATTGLLDTLLLDNGYLTELRTGAAGGLAADLLAKREIEQALIVGAGGQARYQLKRCSACASRGKSSSTRGVRRRRRPTPGRWGIAWESTLPSPPSYARRSRALT